MSSNIRKYDHPIICTFLWNRGYYDPVEYRTEISSVEFVTISIQTALQVVVAYGVGARLTKVFWRCWGDMYPGQDFRGLGVSTFDGTNFSSP